MKKLIGLVVMVCLMTPVVLAQQNPVIFEINGQKIKKSEFMKDFLASIGKNSSDPATPCTYEKRKALEDYVNLYVNYRLKLTDAYNMGLDKNADLIKELKTYRDELAAPYLVDSLEMDKLLREAYEREQYALHAAHILVKIRQNPSPADTLRAYNKALEYYKRAKAGENFYELASEEVERVQLAGLNRPKNPMEGDLGCFTVFDMVYPFESAAYALQPGEICKPIRTRFGYHVIKLISRTKTYGKLTLQHIWINDANGTNNKAEGMANQAWQRLQGGESFESVAANYSDDRTTSSKGGLMPSLPVNQLPPDYVDISQTLKVGEYTKPFHTSYGWHIIKLAAREDIPSFEDRVPFYKQKMSRDVRGSISKGSFAAKMREKYGFIDYVANKKASYQDVLDLMDSSLFVEEWKFKDSMITNNQVLCKVGNKEYTSRDLGWFIKTSQKAEYPWSLKGLLEKRYQEFIDAKTIEYTDSQLEKEYPEFAELVDEYRHGLMIFAYNESEIWKKAVKDTVGFHNFYDQQSAKRSLDNPDDKIYFWGTRARVTVIDVKDNTIINKDKAVKVAQQYLKKQWDRNTLLSKLTKNPSDVTVDLVMVEKGNQSLLQDNQWIKGVYDEPSNNGYKILIVEKILDSELKSFDEARGYYLSEYQDEMERRVTDMLRKKYDVKIHQNVIDEITY